MIICTYSSCSVLESDLRPEFRRPAPENHQRLLPARSHRPDQALHARLVQQVVDVESRTDGESPRADHPAEPDIELSLSTLEQRVRSGYGCRDGAGAHRAAAALREIASQVGRKEAVRERVVGRNLQSRQVLQRGGGLDAPGELVRA